MTIDEIEGATVPGGDGLLLDRGKLVVVQGDAGPAVVPEAAATARARRSSSAPRRATKLRGPSTVDAAKGLYLVVNADFATSTKPFTVAGLPRKAKRSRHGHH